ncbi:MAG: DUF6348 family protein [Gemmataceae bacterium]
MRRLSLLILGVSVGSVGCPRGVPRGGDQIPASGINASLLELFQAHGVDCAPQGEWIVFSKNGMKANASIVREMPQATGMSVQLDVLFEVAPDRTIIESFAGVGQTREQAIADALNNFAMNSFHVLLAAFLKPNEEQVSEEEWTIAGRPRQVTIGDVGIRGKPPVQGEQLVGWFKPFEEKLKSKPLGPGTHWVRLYYAQMQGKAIACEVLLDNDAWEEMQAEMAAFDWPSGKDFYSVRVFLVVRDK